MRRCRRSRRDPPTRIQIVRVGKPRLQFLGPRLALRVKRGSLSAKDTGMRGAPPLRICKKAKNDNPHNPSASSERSRPLGSFYLQAPEAKSGDHRISN